MTEEIEEEKTPVEASSVPTTPSMRPLPSKGLILAATIVGVATLVLAAITLILHYALPDMDEVVRSVFWWAAWVVLIIDVILTFITTSKKYRPSKNIAIAGICGLIGAVMLLVVAFLGK